jgi:small-conductance mechanosensitive channel
LATSTVNLKVFFWVDTFDFGRVANTTRGRVIGRVKRALVEKGFYLPADIQEIKLYGKEKEIPLSLRNLLPDASDGRKQDAGSES